MCFFFLHFCLYVLTLYLFTYFSFVSQLWIIILFGLPLWIWVLVCALDCIIDDVILEQDLRDEVALLQRKISELQAEHKAELKKAKQAAESAVKYYLNLFVYRRRGALAVTIVSCRNYSKNFCVLQKLVPLASGYWK